MRPRTPRSPAIIDTTQDPETPVLVDGVNASQDAARQHVEGRSPAVGGILEHVVDGQQAARRHLLHPARESRFDGSAPWPPSTNSNPSGVRQCRATVGRLAHDGDHDVLQARGARSSAGSEEGCPAARLGVDESGVVVLPPRLVLLGAAMMVEREQHGVRSRAPPRRDRPPTCRSTCRSRAADRLSRPRGPRGARPHLRRRA